MCAWSSCLWNNKAKVPFFYNDRAISSSEISFYFTFSPNKEEWLCIHIHIDSQEHGKEFSWLIDSERDASYLLSQTMKRVFWKIFTAFFLTLLPTLCRKTQFVLDTFSMKFSARYLIAPKLVLVLSLVKIGYSCRFWDLC